jgi:DNA (cytosine-5)-methyltransferase 1
MGYHRAGFDVVGVDIKPQPNYPFEFHQADALGVLREMLSRLVWDEFWWDRDGFDVIHASPPCQSFTAYRRKGHGVGDGYPNLIPETRYLLGLVGVPYVIENVQGAPLVETVRYCGSSFGLDVRRHRFFESSVPLFAPRCDHAWQAPRFPPATNRTNLRRTVEVGVWRIPLEVQQQAMGIDWMTLPELSEAVPPAYTAHIGRQLIENLQVVPLAA